MVSPRRQLAALLTLRWRMVRSPGVRTVIVLAGLFVLYLAFAAARSTPMLEPAAFVSAVQLAPAAFLGFAFLAVVAPLTSGGGSEIVPPDQVVAYPIRPTTQFFGGLVLAPLNLVWVIQLVTLTAETAYVSHGGSGPRAALTSTSYAAAVTVLGQALAWWVAGLRQTRRGRRAVVTMAITTLLGAALAVRLGFARTVLDHSPTRTVVRAVAARPGDEPRWALTTTALLALTALGGWAGARLCGWALRRPTDAGSTPENGPVRRRAAQPSALRELVVVNRASAWRAPALRRGALVLAVLPGVAAAGAGIPWESLTILPGLVAAGAGLLFGINAFSLDGSGALWLASLPHHPRLVALAKVIVLAETVAAAVAVAALAGGLRSPGSPTATQIAAIVLSGLTCTAVVVAIAMSRSVRRPHQALLKGPRDGIAPPGAMTLASAQLSVPAAMVGVLFSGASRGHAVWLPIALAAPLLLLAVLSVRRTLRAYDAPLPRARVVAVVSAG